jgi:hypothetical protein
LSKSVDEQSVEGLAGDYTVMTGAVSAFVPLFSAKVQIVSAIITICSIFGIAGGAKSPKSPWSDSSNSPKRPRECRRISESTT